MNAWVFQVCKGAWLLLHSRLNNMMWYQAHPHWRANTTADIPSQWIFHHLLLNNNSSTAFIPDKLVYTITISLNNSIIHCHFTLYRSSPITMNHRNYIKMQSKHYIFTYYIQCNHANQHCCSIIQTIRRHVLSWLQEADQIQPKKISPGIKVSRWSWDWPLAAAAVHWGRTLSTEHWRWQHSPQSTRHQMQWASCYADNDIMFLARPKKCLWSYDRLALQKCGYYYRSFLLLLHNYDHDYDDVMTMSVIDGQA